MFPCSRHHPASHLPKLQNTNTANRPNRHPQSHPPQYPGPPQTPIPAPCTLHLCAFSHVSEWSTTTPQDNKSARRLSSSVPSLGKPSCSRRKSAWPSAAASAPPHHFPPRIPPHGGHDIPLTRETSYGVRGKSGMTSAVTTECSGWRARCGVWAWWLFRSRIWVLVSLWGGGGRGVSVVCSRRRAPSTGSNPLWRSG